MLKVLIESDNSFLNIGIQNILKSAYGKDVRFIQTVQYKHQENEDYDLYFFCISSEENKVCHSRILDIPLNKGVFFIIKSKGDNLLFEKNKCLGRGRIITYGMRITEIEEAILDKENHIIKGICCYSCSLPFFTPQEIMILKLFISGLNTKEASLITNIPEKAVLDLLKIIRKKLGAKGKKDFYSIALRFMTNNRLRLFGI